MFGIGHPRGSRRPLGAMRGVGALHEVRGFMQCAQPWPVAPEARGVAGRDMVDCACGEVTGSVPRVSSQTKLEVSVAHTRRRCPSGSVATKV